MFIDDKIRTFLEVAKESSLSRAAQNLYLSPVSVKKQMDALEKRCNTQLFIRSNRGTMLTDSGKFLAEEAQRLVALEKAALNRLEEIASPDTRIRIGTSLMRPCRPLVDILARIESPHAYRVEIVPFSDSPESLKAVVENLGDGLIDCFVGPCGATYFHRVCNVLVLGSWDCCIAVSRGDKLAHKTLLTWDDLEGREMVLVQRGDSAELDCLRDEIELNHPSIKVIDAPHFYDPSIFNACERDGVIMETLEAWTDIHPNIVTIPVEWPYQLPYGILYPKNPRPAVSEFIETVRVTNQKNSSQLNVI